LVGNPTGGGSPLGGLKTLGCSRLENIGAWPPKGQRASFFETLGLLWKSYPQEDISCACSLARHPGGLYKPRLFGTQFHKSQCYSKPWLVSKVLKALLYSKIARVCESLVPGCGLKGVTHIVWSTQSQRCDQRVSRPSLSESSIPWRLPHA